MEEGKELAEIKPALIERAASFSQAVRDLVVTNDEELEMANELVKGIKALKREIRADYDDDIDRWHKGWKNALAKRDRRIKPLDEDEEIVKSKMVPYMEEQKRKQREAEEAARRAREEAEAAARRAQEYAEEAARAAEEERQRKAREALYDGQMKEAEKILAKEPKVYIPEVEDVPAPEEVIVPQAKKLEGTYTRTEWIWELQNIDLVPRVLPNGKRPLVLDRGVITELAEKEKDKASVPGIRFFKKTTVVSREK